MDGNFPSFLLDFEREYHVLPQRLFVPVAGSSVMLTDYKFGDEATEEIQERFIEMLDQPVQAEDIHIAEEINTGKYSIREAGGVRTALTNGIGRSYPYTYRYVQGWLTPAPRTDLSLMTI